MRHRSSLLQVHAAVVLFGLAGLFGKWLVLAPVFIVPGRVLFGSLALAFDNSTVPGLDILIARTNNGRKEHTIKTFARSLLVMGMTVGVVMGAAGAAEKKVQFSVTIAGLVGEEEDEFSLIGPGARVGAKGRHWTVAVSYHTGGWLTFVGLTAGYIF